MHQLRLEKLTEQHFMHTNYSVKVNVYKFIISDCNKMINSIATPAFLCHKEPAQGTQSPY